MTRAAIYARYSTDLQSASSIDDQIRICRERLEADDHVLVDAYTDYAISGGSRQARSLGATAMATASCTGYLQTARL